MKRCLRMLLAICMVWAILIPAATAEEVSEMIWEPGNESEETLEIVEEAAEMIFEESAAAEEEVEAVPISEDMQATVSEAVQAGEKAELMATVNYTVPGGLIFFNPSTGAITGYSGNITSAKIPAKMFDVDVIAIGDSAFKDCKSLTSVTIPDSVSKIDVSAFYGCTGLTSMTIPNSVTWIGAWAFLGCTGLTNVTIPNSVTTFEVRNGWDSVKRQSVQCNSAFYGCSGLTSVAIPNSVTSIGGYMFYYCTGLTSVTIPNSVTNIKQSAFWNCNNLADVYYTGTVAEWGKVSVESDNTPLLNANLHFGFTPTPTPTNTPDPNILQIITADAVTYPGEVLKIPVSIHQNSGIAGAAFTVAYDSSVMTLNSIEQGPVFSTGTYSANTEKSFA